MYTHAMTGRVIRDEMTLYAVGVIKNDLLVPPLLACWTSSHTFQACTRAKASGSRAGWRRS